MTLPELVGASPSMTDDGSVVLGMRANNVFMLDLSTGQLLRMLTGLSGSMAMQEDELQGMCMYAVMRLGRQRAEWPCRRRSCKVHVWVEEGRG